MLLRTAQDQRRPARDAEHGKRDDDRRQLEEGDRRAVREPHQHADRKPREDRLGRAADRIRGNSNETRPAAASTGPTDRSTPPVMMTKVVHVAIIPTRAT